MTRATDLPKFARAFLDTVAIGESGGASDDAAYSVLFGNRHFLWSNNTLLVLDPGTTLATPITQWPPSFPDWPGVFTSNGVHTRAAGRYQFEPATYTGSAVGGGPFDPETQDRQAWKLALHTRPTLAADLQSGNTATLRDVAATLQSQWTSLSPENFPGLYTSTFNAMP